MLLGMHLVQVLQNVKKGGAVTGFIYWMAIYPIDVVKTLIQGDDLANPKYKGMIDGFK